MYKIERNSFLFSIRCTFCAVCLPPLVTMGCRHSDWWPDDRLLVLLLWCPNKHPTLSHGNSTSGNLAFRLFGKAAQLFLDLFTSNIFPTYESYFPLQSRMFQVGEDCEVMIRIDEESDDEEFQLISG